MPSASTLLLYVLAASALVAIPGPNHIYIVTRSLSQGRAAGLVSALGVESATLVYMVAASVGLAAVIASSALAFDTVRFVGAAYLIYLGLRVLLRQQPVELTEPARLSLRRVYLEAAAVNLLNPKVALFFVAFLPQFIDPARGPVAGQIVVLGLIITAIGLTSDVVYALAAGQLGGWLGRRPGFAKGQRIATGTTYLDLGVAAAFSGRPATQGNL